MIQFAPWTSWTVCQSVSVLFICIFVHFCLVYDFYFISTCVVIYLLLCYEPNLYILLFYFFKIKTDVVCSLLDYIHSFGFFLKVLSLNNCYSSITFSIVAFVFLAIDWIAYSAPVNSNIPKVDLYEFCFDITFMFLVLTSYKCTWNCYVWNGVVSLLNCIRRFPSLLMYSVFKLLIHTWLKWILLNNIAIYI